MVFIFLKKIFIHLTILGGTLRLIDKKPPFDWLSKFKFKNKKNSPCLAWFWNKTISNWKKRRFIPCWNTKKCIDRSLSSVKQKILAEFPRRGSINSKSLPWENLEKERIAIVSSKNWPGLKNKDDHCVLALIFRTLLKQPTKF